MTKGVKKHVGVATEQAEKAPETAESPLYGVALLKLAMELKKAQTGELEDVLRSVLRKMNLPEAGFRAFLAMNGGLLKTLLHKKQD